MDSSQAAGTEAPNRTNERLEATCAWVLRRFAKAYSVPVEITPVNGKARPAKVNLAGAAYCHPICQHCSHLWVCEENGEQVRPGRVHFSSCLAGHRVALIPLAVHGRIAAIFRLVEPATTPRASLQRQSELIFLLISQCTWPTTRRRAEVRHQGGRLLMNSTLRQAKANATHPQVQKAIEYVEENLSDPRTNVSAVARVLGINATYLSHIFCEVTGMRMSRYIAKRRVELAQSLLASTDWQIKRVAFESGHNNADWFSQVFQSHVGTTPCNYRRQVRSVTSQSC